MFKSSDHKQRDRRHRSKSRNRRVCLGSLESLDRRLLPAVSAVFSPISGALTVFGDGLNNTITASRDATGRILINGATVTAQGRAATVTNTTRIQMFGQSGNDLLRLDETNGELPTAQLFGSAGNDSLIGGSSGDLLFGDAGDDTLLGKGGGDYLIGGAGNDIITGGAGDDYAFGQAGNDRMIWNPGDGSDLNEGGDGADVVEVNAGNGVETFTVFPNGTRVRFDRIAPGPFFIDIGTSENMVINMNGGDDALTAGDGLAPLISLAVHGGAGNDSITGGDGGDLLFGDDGNDLITGGRGADQVQMGAGDDTFVWNPGDGSDTVDGQSGADTMRFNGSNVSEQIDVSAVGRHVRFTRNIASVAMDLNAVETIGFNALGGADRVIVNDLTGTGVTQLNLDLSAIFGSGAGDGQADSVLLTGSSRANTVQVSGAGSNYAVSGLSARVAVYGSEGSFDTLSLALLGGNDSASATGLLSGVVGVTIDGGAGADTLVGSGGSDVLIGGDGNDSIDGDHGDDVIFGGAGNDVIQWESGDANDTIEGGDGSDRLSFNGSDLNERVDVFANGERVRFLRDVANVALDANEIETIDFNALGGADTITVGDLTGTDVTRLNLDLGNPSGSAGVGDGQADTITVNGTIFADVISVSGYGGGATVAGLAAMVRITHAEGTNDSLRVFGQLGSDTIVASALYRDVIGLTLNGGEGDDTLTGSSGADQIIGGRGSDTAAMGAGDDTFLWSPGDGSDTVEGQSGFDSLAFNGANVGELIDVSANGTRTRLTRNVANITMDLNSVESIGVNASGGADTITVNDLSRTGVSEVNIDLSSPPNTGIGDNSADAVVVMGTNGGDVITVAGDSTSVSVIGLPAQVNVKGAEAANDRLSINAGAGDDVVDATSMAAGAIALVADGSEGDDVLLGGDGGDTLIGAAGDDVVIGGPGQDSLDGGIGDNVVIQD